MQTEEDIRAMNLLMETEEDIRAINHFEKMQPYFDEFFKRSSKDKRFAYYKDDVDTLKGWLMASFLVGISFIQKINEKS